MVATAKKLNLVSEIRQELEDATGMSYSGRTNMAKYRDILLRKVVSIDPGAYHGLSVAAKEYVKYACEVINAGGECPEFTDINNVYRGRTLARRLAVPNRVHNTAKSLHGATGRIREILAEQGFGLLDRDVLEILNKEGYSVSLGTVHHTRSEFRRSCRALTDLGLLVRPIKGV